MKISRGLQLRSKGLSIVLVLSLVGCRQSVDLSSVQTMAAGAKTATASFEELADDWYETCVRKVELETISSSVRANFPLPPARSGVSASPTPPPAPPKVYPAGLSPGDLVDPNTVTEPELIRLTSGEISAFDSSQALAVVGRPDFTTVIYPTFSTDQRAALGTALATANAHSIYSCAGSTVVAQQWRHRIDIYLGFFAALGNLAGGATSTDKYGIDGLASSLQTVGVFTTSGETSAFQNLANTLTTDIFTWQRRDALANALLADKDAVDTATAQLVFVGGLYKMQLGQESEALNNFRDSNLHLAQPGADAFAVYQYAKQLVADQDAVNAREQAADAYIASLQKLDAAYGTVVKDINDDDLTAAVAAANSYYLDLHSDLQAVDKAFPGNKK